MSTKGRYGLRAVLEIAAASRAEDPKPVSVGSIAQKQGISEGYLEHLMSDLRKAGIVASELGSKGGYVLGRPADQITAGDVLKAVGEKVEPVECAALSGTGTCTSADECRTKRAWKRLNEGVAGILESMTLQSLLEECGG